MLSQTGPERQKKCIESIVKHMKTLIFNTQQIRYQLSQMEPCDVSPRVATSRASCCTQIEMLGVAKVVGRLSH